MITPGLCPHADLSTRRVAHHHRTSRQQISDFAGILARSRAPVPPGSRPCRNVTCCAAMARVKIIGGAAGVAVLIRHVGRPVHLSGWTAPRTGERRTVGSGWGQSRLRDTPAQGSARPWGLGREPKTWRLMWATTRTTITYMFTGPATLSRPGRRRGEPGTRSHHGATPSARRGAGYLSAGG
jgi:hypothetical protein